MPAGARFSTGFLEGLAAWAAAKQKEQAAAAPIRPVSAPSPSADAPATEGAAAAKGTADSGELAAVTQALAALQPRETEQPAAQPDIAAVSTGSAPVAADCSTDSAAAEDLRFVPQLVSSQHQECSTLHQGTPSLDSTAATNDVSGSGAVELDELRDDASSAPASQQGMHCNGPATACQALSLV